MISKPLTGLFERSFQKQAFKIVQKALLASGVRVILHEPDWSRVGSWSETDKQFLAALSQIGQTYYDMATDKGEPIELRQ